MDVGSKTVFLPKPRGFCAGVIRAIDIVTLALEKLGRPVYVRKEIVHNRFVVDELAAQGAVFVENLDEVPDGATTIFSAHGVAPEVWQEAKLRKLRVIDATCPLVTKVHIEVIRYARENYSIILSGIATTTKSSEHSEKLRIRFIWFRASSTWMYSKAFRRIA